MSITSVDLTADAKAEAARLSRARLVGNNGTDRDRRVADVDRPLIARARGGDTRRVLSGRWLVIWRVAYEDAGGRVVESRLVSLLVRPAARPGGVRHRQWIRALLRRGDAQLRRVVDEAAQEWRAAVVDLHERFTSARVDRERAITACSCSEPRPFQPGLFDRRSERARRIASHEAADAAGLARARIDAAVNAGHLASRRGELLLVLTS
jgi:hypothetical protein